MKYDDIPKCADGSPDMESDEWNIYCGEIFWGMFDDESNICPHCHDGYIEIGCDGNYCNVCGFFDPIS